MTEPMTTMTEALRYAVVCYWMGFLSGFILGLGVTIGYWNRKKVR